MLLFKLNTKDHQADSHQPSNMDSMRELPQQLPDLSSSTTTMSNSSRPSTVSIEHEKQDATDTAPPEKWKPTRAFYIAFTALFVITLAASLTSTSLSIALPVCKRYLTLQPPHLNQQH